MNSNSWNSNEMRERVSKFLSGLLRHFPDKFGLTLDRYGWVELDKVVRIVSERYSLSEKESMRIIREVV